MAVINHTAELTADVTVIQIAHSSQSLLNQTKKSAPSGDIIRVCPSSDQRFRALTVN